MIGWPALSPNLHFDELTVLAKKHGYVALIFGFLSSLVIFFGEIASLVEVVYFGYAEKRPQSLRIVLMKPR